MVKHMDELMNWAKELESEDSSPAPSTLASPKLDSATVTLEEGSITLGLDEECTPRPAGADLEIEAGGLRASPAAPAAAQEGGSSILSCVANLANTNMGVGLLALPSAVSSAGMVGGLALLLLSAAIATAGSLLLADCVEAVGRPASLSKVTRSAMAPLPRALGTTGILLADFAVVVIGSSCAIGYLIVVGDTIPLIKAWLVGPCNIRPPAKREATNEVLMGLSNPHVRKSSISAP